jgi:hypothetical protein
MNIMLPGSRNTIIDEEVAALADRNVTGGTNAEVNIYSDFGHTLNVSSAERSI